MDQQNTIPSILGPRTSPLALTPMPETHNEAPQESSVVMKLVFWAALGLLAYGALKYLVR